MYSEIFIQIIFQNCTFWIISTTYLLNSSFFSDPISEITSSGKGIRSTRFASLRMRILTDWNFILDLCTCTWIPTIFLDEIAS